MVTFSSRWGMLSKVRRRFTFLALTSLLVAVITARAEVIDRMVAVIDNTFIITLSDIRHERSIQAALGRDSENDEKVLESLIEKHLFEQQIELFRDIPVDEDEVTQRLRGVQVPPTVTMEDLRNAVRDEIRRNEFTVQRFRPFVKVTEEEVLDVYEKSVLPEYRAAGRPLPSVEQGMQEARTIVIADKMVKEVEDWLDDIKGRASIEKISK